MSSKPPTKPPRPPHLTLVPGSGPPPSGVRADTCERMQNEATVADIMDAALAVGSPYTPEEPAAIDEATRALTPVISAIHTLEDIETWVPPAARAPRAILHPAIGESRAVTHYHTT